MLRPLRRRGLILSLRHSDQVTDDGLRKEVLAAFPILRGGPIPLPFGALRALHSPARCSVNSSLSVPQSRIREGGLKSRLGGKAGEIVEWRKL